MGQIDYVLKFADKPTALADPVTSAQTFTDSQGVKLWPPPNCVEVIAWRNSQDTLDGGGNPVHTPLAGYFILISLDHVVNALLNHAAVQLVIDRDLMNVRTPGFVLKSGVNNTVLQDLRISPVFAGMMVPWGSLN